jgi:outer membrane protein
MKSNLILPLLAVFCIMTAANAQQKTSLSLNDAVSMALSKSDEVGLANTKVNTRNYERQIVKDNQYPDVKISGQYLRLTNADVKLKSSNESASDPNAEPQSAPRVNQLAYGSANVSMPLFSGFKLKNSIIASDNLYRAEKASAEYTKEETALKVVEYYGDLYKAQRSVELLNESLKSGNQRVKEFTDREQNGIIARNDLLQAQLQLSRIRLSLDEAETKVRLINHSLITLLKMPEATEIVVSPDNLDQDLFSKSVKTEADALQSRKDLEALRFQKKAGESNIKVAKSGYFPSLALVGGYVMLDLQNVVTVQYAMNFGVGLSYNLSSLFKNPKEVKLAKSRVEEISHQEAMLTDYAKTQMNTARENYELSLKQATVYNEAVDQATENFRIVKDKYDNGLSDTNDLLEADVNQLATRINQAYAKANVVLKYYELLEVSGQLIESFTLTKN